MLAMRFRDALPERKGCSEKRMMGGRIMSGFLFVDEKDCKGKALGNWIDLALGFVETLPKK